MWYRFLRGHRQVNRFARLFHALLAEGIALAPGPYEIMFPSLAHRDSELDRTVEAFHAAAVTL